MGPESTYHAATNSITSEASNQQVCDQASKDKSYTKAKQTMSINTYTELLPVCGCASRSLDLEAKAMQKLGKS